MSVAGILASSLFSNALSAVGQKTPSTTMASSALGSPNTPSSFGATLHQMSSAPAASASTPSLSTEMNQLGQDIKSGDLSGAQSHFDDIRGLLTHRYARVGNATPGETATNPTLLGQGLQNSTLASAWQSYSAEQLSNTSQTNSGALSFSA